MALRWQKKVKRHKCRTTVVNHKIYYRSWTTLNWEAGTGNGSVGSGKGAFWKTQFVQKQTVGNGNNETDCRRTIKLNRRTETENQTRPRNHSDPEREAYDCMHNYHANIIEILKLPQLCLLKNNFGFHSFFGGDSLPRWISGRITRCQTAVTNESEAPIETEIDLYKIKRTPGHTRSARPLCLWTNLVNLTCKSLGTCCTRLITPHFRQYLLAKG